jgi:hypothetical protein
MQSLPVCLRGTIDGEGSDETAFTGATSDAEGCIEKFDQLAQAFLAAGKPVERASIADDMQKQAGLAQSGDAADYKRAM